MQPRTRRLLVNAVIAAAVGAYLFVLLRSRPAEPLASPALDAVPAGALVVASADVAALRATALGQKLLGPDRDIPGLGKVRDVCGFDPFEHVSELVLAIPAAGDSGDFGIVAAGDIPDKRWLDCTSKVIEQRGGRPVESSIGSFRTVRDGTLVTSGAEIAVRQGGPMLFGAGLYLRAMADAADGRVDSVGKSLAHARLAERVQGSTARVTIVLTPQQRADLAQALEEQRGPQAVASILGGAAAITLGDQLALDAVIACERAEGCAGVAALLRKERDARAEDVATRIVGFSEVIAGIRIDAEGEMVRIRAEIPADKAAVLLERLLLLRGVRHPMPKGPAEPAASGAPPPPDDGAPPSATPPASGAPSGSAAPPGSAAASDAGAPDAMALPAPDEVLTPRGDAGAPGDAGARDASR